MEYQKLTNCELKSIVGGSLAGDVWYQVMKGQGAYNAAQLKNKQPAYNKYYK